MTKETTDPKGKPQPGGASSWDGPERRRRNDRRRQDRRLDERRTAGIGEIMGERRQKSGRRSDDRRTRDSRRDDDT